MSTLMHATHQPHTHQCARARGRGTLPRHRHPRRTCRRAQHAWSDGASDASPSTTRCWAQALRPPTPPAPGPAQAAPPFDSDAARHGRRPSLCATPFSAHGTMRYGVCVTARLLMTHRWAPRCFCVMCCGRESPGWRLVACRAQCHDQWSVITAAMHRRHNQNIGKDRVLRA